jgi:hypothetical protein
MPNWNEVLSEINGLNEGPFDKVRQKYLRALQQHSKRNVLVYYSGWLQKGRSPGIDLGINDSDMTGFMTCSSGIDRSKGLDLILHTPGGSVAATEAIINYLRSLYGEDIRAVIPQIAMSGGTLMAMSCKSIVMGKQSSLGPIDPQMNGMPAQAILEEFKEAYDSVIADPRTLPIWQTMLAKFGPTWITNCRHAIDWSNDLLAQCLKNNMLKSMTEQEQDKIIDDVKHVFGKQVTSKAHNRHINIEQARGAGLKVDELEKDQKFQDLVLTLHHALTIALSQTTAYKIISNHKGVAYIPHVSS